jgi:hypothetical protein
MPFDKQQALNQIYDALVEYHQFEASYAVHNADGQTTNLHAPESRMFEMATRLRTTLERLAPPNAGYGRELSDSKGPAGLGQQIRSMAGVLQALRDDYDWDRLRSFREMVQSDVFSDFLEMAEYLMKDEGLKDPAAVIAGGVLEQHLRALCGKHDISLPARPKLETMNAELAKVGAYGRNDQKQVTAWADIRNDAAHGDYQKYTREQVALMVQGIRDFMARNPA